MTPNTLTPAMVRRLARDRTGGRTSTETRGCLRSESSIDDPDPWQSWNATITVSEYAEDGTTTGQAEIASASATQVGVFDSRSLLDICDELGADHLAMAGTIHERLGEIEMANSVVASVLLIEHLTCHPEAVSHGWRTEALRYLIEGVGQYGQGVLVAAYVSQKDGLGNGPGLTIAELAALHFDPFADLWIRHLDMRVDLGDPHRPPYGV